MVHKTRRGGSGCFDSCGDIRTILVLSDLLRASNLPLLIFTMVSSVQIYERGDPIEQKLDARTAVWRDLRVSRLAQKLLDRKL